MSFACAANILQNICLMSSCIALSAIAFGVHQQNVLNEGDLFSQGIVRERLCVLTVHKAKGLEMDNVVCYDR